MRRLRCQHGLATNTFAAHVLTGEALDGIYRTDGTEFELAAKIAPREPDIHFGLGYLYWKSHKYDEAEREFNNELSLDPKHAQALAYLGDTELKRENLERAKSLLERSVETNSNIRLAYLDLGAILVRQKQYPAAVKQFRQALELDPTQPDTHYHLGRAYQAMGNTERADQEFAQGQRTP